MVKLLVFILIFFIIDTASAETIYLKSGKVIEGKIIEKTEKYIKVDFHGIGLTYYLDEIDRIENQNSSSEASIEPTPNSSSTNVQNDKNIYYVKEHGLKIRIPDGWIVIDKNNPQQLNEETGGNTAGVICIFKESSAVSAPLIYIKSNLLPELPKDYTIDDYTEVLKRRNLQIQQKTPGLEIIENSHVVNLGSNKCSKAVTKFRAPDGDEVYVYYHFLNAKMSYSIMGSLSADKFEAHKDIFEKIAATLQFGDIKTDSMELADAEQLNMQGSQYFSAGQFDKAIEIHEKALVKAVDLELRAKILTMLSSSYLEKGITNYLIGKNDADYKKAIDYAEQALKIKPNYWLALGNIAVVYMNMSDLEKADFYYSEAEKYADQNSTGYQQLILNHTLIKKTLDARKNKKE